VLLAYLPFFVGGPGERSKASGLVAPDPLLLTATRTLLYRTSPATTSEPLRTPASSPVSFCLFLFQASDSKFWVVVCLFAAATPLGISIGYASSVLGHGPVSAAMSALASGTFLYVALNEVIPKELEHPDGHRLAKVAALLLGFGLMSLLAVWA